MERPESKAKLEKVAEHAHIGFLYVRVGICMELKQK